jgi:ATP-dependent RNA helicase DeaD
MMTSFAEAGLPEALLQAITALGYEQPTTIQQQVLPVLASQETDLIALAQTGTGKTAAFGLPLLAKIDPELNTIQGVILSPTRELCTQVAEEIKKFAQFMPQVKIVCLYGGVDIEQQIRLLKKGAHIVVATPGRLIDLLNRGVARLQAINYLVLDEADKMLEMGFVEPVEEIMASTNESKRVWLFSATMPPAIKSITHRFMKNPMEFSAGRVNAAAENVTHVYYMTDDDLKNEVLQRIIDFHPDMYGIIFTRTKNDAQNTAEELVKNGYNADALHGDLAQGQRERVMKMFKEKTLQLLVATDVAARGLDVNNLSHVVNLGVPDDLESYVHRVGRTARAGKKGTAITILTPRHRRQIELLERMVKATIERNEIPTAEQVIQKRFEHFAETFQNLQYNASQVQAYTKIFQEKVEALTREELIERLCASEMSRVMDYYRDAPDLNRYDRKDRRKQFESQPAGARSFGEDGGKYRRFSINVGNRDGISKLDLIDFIAETMNIEKSHVNQVRLFDNHSFFDLFADEAHLADTAFEDSYFDQRKIRVEPDLDPNRGRGSFGSGRGGYDRQDRGRFGQGGGRRNDRNFGGNYRGEGAPRRQKVW